VIRWTLLLVAPALLSAQSPQVKRGAEVYRTTCGNGYCHGAEGAAGRAPKLAGRSFSAAYVFQVVLDGKPGTGMPGFSQQLKSEDIEAVTQYILSLSAPAGAGASSSKTPVQAPPPAAQKGKALFFDAVRMGGCGKCHELEDRGSPVGPDLKALTPAQIASMRVASHTRAITASPVNEDPFPAVAAEQTPEHVQVFDLSSPLPVLRTFQSGQVRIAQGSSWSHSTAAQNYSDADLAAISSYLNWLASTQPAK
jgi:mono/diheme cytochrome c family protein